MNAKVRLDVQVMGFPSEHDISIVFPLEEWLVREAFVSIDLPSEDANGIERMCCTSAAEIGKVKMNRKRMSKMLSNILTEKILEVMDSNDTIMGYEKDRGL